MNKSVLKPSDWINWQWQVALQGIVNGILSTSSRNTGLSTSSTRTPQWYGLKTVRHHTVDTEYRVTDSKLRILRGKPTVRGFEKKWVHEKTVIFSGSTYRIILFIVPEVGKSHFQWGVFCMVLVFKTSFWFLASNSYPNFISKTFIFSKTICVFGKAKIGTFQITYTTA
jgi:hypothetical protein